MATKLKIKTGDSVDVLSGKDAGKRGTVTRVLPAQRRIVVEKVNMVKRHTQPRPAPGSGRRRCRSRTWPSCARRAGSRAGSATGATRRTATRCGSAATAGRTSTSEYDRDPHAPAEGAVRLRGARPAAGAARAVVHDGRPAA